MKSVFLNPSTDVCNGILDLLWQCEAMANHTNPGAGQQFSNVADIFVEYIEERCPGQISPYSISQSKAHLKETAPLN